MWSLHNRLTWREIIALYRLSVLAAWKRDLPARYNIPESEVKCAEYC